MICIPKEQADVFKKALGNRDITVSSLLKMSTESRTALFEKMGGNGKEINQLFEQKLILKDKVKGLENWIAKVTQEGRYSPEKIAELKKATEEFKQQQQERIFSPKEQETFLNDLADKAVGTHITEAQAAVMGDLTSKISKYEDQLDPVTGKWSSPEAKAQYGATAQMLERYKTSLVEGESNPLKVFKNYAKEVKESFKDDKIGTTRDTMETVAKTITDNSVAAVAAWDASFMGRQGLNTLMTHPSIWWSVAKKGVKDFATVLTKKNGKQAAEDAHWADVLSRPDYINGEYQRAGILPKHEEAYQGTLSSKIPGIGRIFDASQVAFEQSARNARLDTFDILKEAAKKNGVTWDDVQIKDIGALASSATARGDIGKLGESQVTRLVMWAPKMLKANYDVLTAHSGGMGLKTSFARKEARMNLAKIIGTSVGIATVFNALVPGSAETDPRSSNFGKIKIGDTTFDYTGGKGSLLVLAARQLMGETKSTTTGLIRPFGTDYGDQSRLSVLGDFVINKAPPITAAVWSAMRGTNAIGEPVTPGSLLASTAVPITVQNAFKVASNNPTPTSILGVVADALGVSANTLTNKADWSKNPGKELEAFKAKVGEEKFNEANAKFSAEYGDWLKKIADNPKYQALDTDTKQKVITAKKADIKDKILKSYGFHYVAPKTKKTPTF